MKISAAQREIEDPENFAQAYSWEPGTGFYNGTVRRQPNPREPGRYLSPAYTTQIRPTFLEGHFPKWNGENWELIPKQNVKRETVSVRVAIDEVKEKFSSEMQSVVASIVKSEVQKQMSEARQMIVEMISNHSLNLSEVVSNESRVTVQKRFDVESTKLSEIISVLVSDLQRIETRAHDLHAQTLSAANEVLTRVNEVRSAVESDATNVKRWYQFWKSSEAKPQAQGDV